MKKRKKKSQPPARAQAEAEPGETGPAATGPAGAAGPPDAVVRSHLRFGWWSLLAFLTLGIGLEAMHGFKVGWYLDEGASTRRLMWTLAHAHGVLLALVHLAFAATLHLGWGPAGQRRETASALFKVAGLLLPAGFFLGGVWIYGGDPGLGILLVPVGALGLFVAVFLTARGASS